MVHSYPVIRRSKCFVSSACHNAVTWLETTAQQLTLLDVMEKNRCTKHHRRDVTMSHHDDVTFNKLRVSKSGDRIVSKEHQ